MQAGTELAKVSQVCMHDYSENSKKCFDTDSPCMRAQWKMVVPAREDLGNNVNNKEDGTSVCGSVYLSGARCVGTIGTNLA